MNKIERKIHKIDLTGKTIGRSATQIATWLRGKNKPEYDPAVDGGDIVEAIGVSKVKFSGKKLAQKKYFHFSGYLGGLKTKKMSDLYKKDPADVLKRAVREMLPPNRLRTSMMKRLIIR
jgi:large subunit ribosomal protein L13